MVSSITGGSAVSVVTKGTLMEEQINGSITGNGTFYCSKTVATGKKIIPKYCNAQNSGGSYTITALDIQIGPDAGNLVTIGSLSGVNTLVANLDPLNIEIPAGWIIRWAYSASTYVSTGTPFVRWLYQEFNA